jgi:C4-dicarboxylate-specific signal transduction histidine kinase
MQGIKENISNRIFEPYFTTKDKSEGTGLGLHIAKTLLTNSLNGNISVKNIKKGVKFDISLKK